MATLTNSEGLIITHTNGLLETILLQLNASSTYYTSGENGVVFIKTGSNKVSLFNYTYHITRNIFQNYTINGNTINNCDLAFILELQTNTICNQFIIVRVL